MSTDQGINRLALTIGVNGRPWLTVPTALSERAEAIMGRLPDHRGPSRAGWNLDGPYNHNAELRRVLLDAKPLKLKSGPPIAFDPEASAPTYVS